MHDEGGDEIRVLVQGGVYQSASYVGDRWAEPVFAYYRAPFPHGTGSLSVTREYLALRDGPRGFRRGFTCPAVLRILN